MGRVKTLFVKRTARKLIEKFPNKFTDNFEVNKKIISSMLEIEKKIRNNVAGYITRLVKREKQKQQKIIVSDHTKLDSLRLQKSKNNK